MSDFNTDSSKFGLKYAEFENIDSKTKKKLIRLMARIMEKAYRRGVQQTLHLSQKNAIDEWITDKPWVYRYEKSLDVSIGLDGFNTSSIERLIMEEKLHNIGLYDQDT